TRAAVAAERAMLSTLEAGCTAPVAALADIADNGDEGWELYLRGAVLSLDGEFVLRRSRTGMLAEAAVPTVAPLAAAAMNNRENAAGEIGRALAADLLADGADHVLGVLHDPHA